MSIALQRRPAEPLRLHLAEDVMDAPHPQAEAKASSAFAADELNDCATLYGWRSVAQSAWTSGEAAVAGDVPEGEVVVEPLHVDDAGAGGIGEQSLEL
jgi:hypothetical protein